VASGEEMTFEEYETEAVSTAIYPGQNTALGLMYVALKMNGEAGELAEHIGKALRDDDLSEPFERYAVTFNSLTPERQTLIMKEIGDVLWYLAAAAREVGTNLSTIAQGNITKLRDRKERGKLGGSGDNR
jgi:NTP pyrophosphatase (non-canonical NTP hydrolase)